MTHWSRSVGSEPRKQRTDVAALNGAGLLAGNRLDVFAVEQRFELEAAELLDQIGGRLLTPCSAPAAELGRGEQLDHLPQPRLLGLEQALAPRARSPTPATEKKIVQRNQDDPEPWPRRLLRLLLSSRALPADPFARIVASVITRPFRRKKFANSPPPGDRVA